MLCGAKVAGGVTSAWRNVRTAAHIKSGLRALDRPLKCAYNARRSGVVDCPGRENFKKSISSLPLIDTFKELNSSESAWHFLAPFLMLQTPTSKCEGLSKAWGWDLCWCADTLPCSSLRLPSPPSHSSRRLSLLLCRSL